MPDIPSLLKGVIHGRMIELNEAPGLPDGQNVAVTLQPLQVEPLPPGEGIRRSAGAWADDAEALDEFLSWNREQRKVGRRETSP